MIKQSNLLKWTQNNRNNSKNGTNKSWIHPPDTLQHGHVAYLVKFLGSIEVDHAKGIDVVKEGIRKLKFSQQLKKSEGTKTPKVEVTISIDGVAIQDQKTKQILHQYPLHRISYCANDKSDKKFFSFIAKEENIEKHMCFVFASDKLAEDITLTIGEAFDLAYRKFLDTSKTDLEAKKQLMIFQKRVGELEKENALLKQRLLEITRGNLTENGNMKNGQNPQNLLHLNGDSASRHHSNIDSNVNATLQQNARNEIAKSMPTTSPSQELFNLVSLPITPAVGTKLENLVLDDIEDFNPREDNVIMNGNKGKINTTDIFGATPFNPAKVANVDPFGMGDFSSVQSHGVDLENAIGEIDKKISEMRDGFQRGISFGNDDFFDSATEVH